jgi:hypothetical protein
MVFKLRPHLLGGAEKAATPIFYKENIIKPANSAWRYPQYNRKVGGSGPPGGALLLYCY